MRLFFRQRNGTHTKLWHGSNETYINSINICGIIDIFFISYDDYPMVVAQSAQAKEEKTLMIQCFDSEVKVLKDKGNIYENIAAFRKGYAK